MRGACLLVILHLLNPRRRLFRWPLKVTFLGAVFLFTLYPNPLLLIRHMRHWVDLGALIEPDEPTIAPLVEAAKARIAANPAAGGDAQRELEVVEEVVYEHIPYAWDWDAWGCVDYLPTAAEAMLRGREDCDGRAVVAASVLRKLGHDAQLITDGSHMWVRTESGETMAPMATASGRTFSESSRGGLSIDRLAVFGIRALLIDWPQSLGFGAAVFPPLRVAAIAAAILVCLLNPRATARRAAISALLAMVGVLIWRWECSNPWDNSLFGAWSGIGACVLGGALALRVQDPGSGENTETTQTRGNY